MRKGRMPTFLVIGAARSGTTALYTYLRQHPDIFMSSIKEPNFFAFEDEVLDFAGPGAEYVNNSTIRLADYRPLFENATHESAIGEASPLYLYSHKAPRRIHTHIPAVKLVAILRNPVEQAFSHFLYARRQVLEPLEDFMSALQAEGQRERAHWQPLFQYSQFPRYYQQLQRYHAVFPDDQIKVFLYEDFESDPVSVLQKIFAFLGVDETFAPDLTYRPNAGGVPKLRWLQNLVMQPHSVTRALGAVIPETTKRRMRDVISDYNLETVELPQRSRERLLLDLRDDILKLEAFLQRDLSAWLE